VRNRRRGPQRGVEVSLFMPVSARRHPEWERRVDDVLCYRVLVDPPLKTLAELGREWGLSRERVQQMERRVRLDPMLARDPIINRPLGVHFPDERAS
jgi:hypothetical protein